jgi:predicted amino acid dehydrogenase
LAAGKLAPVEAAALGYLPLSLMEYTGLSRTQIVHEWCDDLPVFDSVLETSLGRIASITLPRFSSELYDDQEDLVKVVLEALALAGRLGARTVSLTGLIPSATDYGRAVAAAVAGRSDLPMITTGHATTAATVVLAIKRVIQEGGRDLAQERVGFLGLGSIGRTSLRLMLSCLPHPAEIRLCDVYDKRDLLEEARREIVSEFGFRGTVQVVESRADVPPEFYDSTLIVGATNVPDILDIARVKPGTMIVDDSGPHCFAPQQAIGRFREQDDILFTAGGVLRSPHPMTRLIYLPRQAEPFIQASHREALMSYNPFDITGCVLSSLFSSRFADLNPTVGLVDVGSCFQHYDRLGQLGFRAADLHCEGYVLPETSIGNFRQRFGGVSFNEQERDQ